MSGGRSAEPPDDVVCYVLGEMDLDERIAFEVRMAEHDDLAREVAAAAAVDAQLRRAASMGTTAVGARGRLRRGAAAAAILVLAIGAVVWAWSALRGGAEGVKVAVVPTSARFEQLVAQLGIAPDAAPAEAMRGEGADIPDGGTRVDELLRRAQDQVDRALAEPAASVQGEAFVVPLAAERDVWVAVVGEFDDGSAKLYYPA